MILLTVTGAMLHVAGEASGAVSLLGVQYQQDDPLSEYQCFWKDKDYPNACGIALPGANLHVFIKNDGTSAVTLDDVTLAGQGLKYALRQLDLNGHITNSIWFRWDNPPQTILDAGEPAWFKMDPASIPGGGAGQVIVRLRRVPVTSPLAVAVDTSSNILSTSIAVDPNVPQLANISFSTDLKKVYLYWRRSGGAVPATVKMDGADVNSITTTVGDSASNYAVSVVSLSAALPEMSYHVFQGVYADGATATGGIRAWVNPFIYCSWGAFPVPDGNTAMAQAWLDTCLDRGINTLEMNSASSGLMGYLGTGAGRAYADSRNYGFIKDDANWGTWSNNPRMWFIDDEPDIEEANLLNNFCGTGYKLPCSSNQAGTMGMHFIARGEELRRIKNRPTTINMDGTWKPYSYFAYGQLSDCLCIDHYFQPKVRHAYTDMPHTLPLYQKATVIYATARAGTLAAEPNPSRQLLYSCQINNDGPLDPWPWAAPECKRVEAYYAMAAGAKGLGYWWFKKAPNASNGLGDDNLQAQDPPLWEEIGLLGAEIKLLQPYLVTSHPVDLDAAGSTNVWVRALARGADTFILFVVNDDYWLDQDYHNTPVGNASVTINLPTWMRSSPAAFEASRNGVNSLSSTLNGSSLTLSLGTLDVATIVIVTIDPQLRTTMQQRYDEQVRPGICRFAPAVCTNNPPSITQHPTNRTVVTGGTATFTVAATGTNPLSYRWQKNGGNLSDGGHYSGATTATLTIALCDSNDAGNYRCVVTNAYGTATSNAATLTVSLPSGPTITQHPEPQSVCTGSEATFTVAATGTGSLSYQWQKGALDLADGSPYSGATTATLTVSAASGSEAGNYRCVVTDSYGSTNSNAAVLTVLTCTPGCAQNPGFESGFANGVGNGWIKFIIAGNEGADLAFSDETTERHGGSHSQEIYSHDVGHDGGVYQRFPTMAGQPYTVKGWIKTYSPQGTGIAEGLFGVDPAGGTDPTSPTVMWASKPYDYWSQDTWNVTAQSGYVTIYLRGRSTKDASKNKTAYVWVDDVEVAPGAPADGVPQAISPTSIRWEWTDLTIETGYRVRDGGGADKSGLLAANKTTWTEATGISPNTQYIRRICAVNDCAESDPSIGQAVYSLSVPPVSGTIMPSPASPTVNESIVWTAAGFGPGKVQHYRYTWDQSATHAWTGSEPQWASGTIITQAASSGSWFLHVRGYNGDNVANGTYDYPITVGVSPVPADLDGDGDVDLADFELFYPCMGESDLPASGNCGNRDLDHDNDVDQSDFGIFQRCYSEQGSPADPNCANG